MYIYVYIYTYVHMYICVIYITLRWAWRVSRGVCQVSGVRGGPTFAAVSRVEGSRGVRCQRRAAGSPF